jgi:membrane protein DedA with SNARE-associated domain
MNTFLQTAADFIGRHHEWAALILGVTTFLESLVLIGAFVPATALMLLAGGLVATGVLDPFAVLFACVVGAVLGDAVSFYVGRRLGGRALRHPVFARYRRAIARTRLVCRRYGMVSIFVGRFFGPLRAFAPLIAGMFRMRRRTFQTANVVSALIWVPAMLAPGYIGAKGLARLELFTEADQVTLLIVGGIVLLVAAGLTWRVMAHLNSRPALNKVAARTAS